MTKNLSPVRSVAFGPSGVVVSRDENGDLLLGSPHRLGNYPKRITERLTHWAQREPERIFLAQRTVSRNLDAGGSWRMLSYAATLERVQRIGQALIDRRLSAERPLAILSGNDMEHALLALAAMHVGIPYVPISPAYSLVSRDHVRLRSIVSLLTPGLTYAANGRDFALAIKNAVPPDVELVLGDADDFTGHATPFEELIGIGTTSAVNQAHHKVTPDTVAKILFTSGSTSEPKGVINTQRMLCSNQEMICTALPFLRDTPPVLVDWLPWHHTFGGNHNLGLVLYNGGTLYIDEGKPLPGMFERSVRNLREIAPTAYFNVPRGFEELLPYLQREPALREKFFSRVSILFYAGAGLAQPVWDAFDRLALQTCGERIHRVTGLGSTETAPFATCANWEGGQAGMIGLPVPGVELKLVQVDGKLEARFRGPNVTPGYWRAPHLADAAFDAEGYYRMGDALRFVDDEHPELGLLFDGRLAEDFKLSSGTWISVGSLRSRIIATGAPYVQDVVIAGHDRDFVAAVIIPRLTDCAALATGLPVDAVAKDILAHGAVRAHFQEMLDELARTTTGSASRIVRAVLLADPPSIDAGEITDKGTVNQRAMIANRVAVVESLYARQPGPDVLCVHDASELTRELDALK